MEDRKALYTGPMRMAHRGVVQAAPENTLGAFQAAADRGYEGIEIDIQMSKDGEIIVAHDENFTRMTLGHPTGFSNRRICDMTWEEISRMEIPYANHMLPEELPEDSRNEDLAILPFRRMGQEKGSDYETAFAGEKRMAHLMRFLDFDRWFEGVTREMTIEIEVKAPGMMPRMLEILAGSKNCGRYIIFSGVQSYIDEIQGAVRANGKPDGLRLGANIRVLTEERKKLVTGMDLFEVGLNDRRFTAEDVKWLNDRGIEVFSNLGDYPEWWGTLVGTGALGFKTNYPGAYTAWWMENFAGR